MIVFGESRLLPSAEFIIRPEGGDLGPGILGHEHRCASAFGVRVGGGPENIGVQLTGLGHGRGLGNGRDVDDLLRLGNLREGQALGCGQAAHHEVHLFFQDDLPGNSGGFLGSIPAVANDELNRPSQDSSFGIELFHEHFRSHAGRLTEKGSAPR